MAVVLTDKAKAMIEEIANETGEHYSVRLLVRGGGCSGTSPDMYFSDEVRELDDVFDFDGIQVIIDQFSHSLLGDFTLEYIDTPMNQGFKFLTDSSSRSSCGCGSSIGII